MLNQGFILCLSFTMIVGITLFLFVNQKIKKLDKSVDTMIELIYGYSKELNTYKENITNLMEKKEYSTGSSSEPTSEPESPRVHEVYGSNPSKKIYINGNGITSVINEPTFGITFQNQDIDGQIESDDRVVVSDDEAEYEDDEDEADQNNDVETITKSSLYDDVLNKITKNTEELVDTKPRIVKLDFEESTKSLLGEHNMRSNSNSESESDSELELEQKQVVEPENEYIDYSKLSVNKLKSVLKEKNYHGIRSVNKMKKQELISALENINNKNSNVNEEDEEGKEDENEHEDVNENVNEHEDDNEPENVNQSMKNTINNIFKTNETVSLDQSVGKSFLIEDEVEEGNENGGETEIENIEIAKQ